jgi:hypothetical protein
MRRFTLPLLALLGLAALAACAAMTEEQCRGADWRAVGVADGAEGRGPERLEAHRRACAPASVTPDARAWEAGRQEGLRLYCRPAKAYDVARRGGAIRAVCTSAELERMQAAYDWGREYWRLELEIEDLRSEIRAIDREIARLPPGAGSFGGLLARRAMLESRLGLAELRQRRYATWPP